MTLQQQAVYGLLYKLPDESAHIVIQVIRRMLWREREKIQNVSVTVVVVTPKMKAFLRMQELRKETLMYDVPEVQRDIAMDKKLG